MNPFQKIKFIFVRINIYLRYNKNIYNTIKWILAGKEITNFTYPIKNNHELIHVANAITDLDYNIIKNIIDELDIKNNNNEMKLFFTERFFKEINDPKKFGRRVLWYILARAIKPDVIIESGVFKGMGTGLLIFALHKNSHEKPFVKFEYKGLDIKLNNLFYNEKHSSKVEAQLIEQDSIEFLRNYKDKKKILYISDAEHNYDFEMQEYELIKKNFAPGSIIISDSGSKSLSDFSIVNNKKMICFTENPEEHWYKGSKCSVSYGY
tara:strand:+ start:452 stop:1246 length:795 start_codon:yes stop_codon:yes gene_type:complete